MRPSGLQEPCKTSIISLQTLRLGNCRWFAVWSPSHMYGYETHDQNPRNLLHWQSARLTSTRHGISSNQRLRASIPHYALKAHHLVLQEGTGMILPGFDLRRPMYRPSRSDSTFSELFYATSHCVSGQLANSKATTGTLRQGNPNPAW
jgi:hypothetical protein